MAFGAKTNERPGTRASVRHLHVSAYKAREVLDLIRGKHVSDADEILQFVERDVAIAIRKVLASAVANAQNNDGQDPETLFVSACYADEGPTMKRWRPRARGRATRIRKRTTHITIIVSRLGERELAQRADKAAAPGHTGRRTAARASEARRERVARSRRRDTEKAGLSEDEATDEATTDEADAVTDEVTTDEATEAVETDEATAEVDAADDTVEAADEAPAAEASDADEADSSEKDEK
jgi:large subunit ribosomal protein L22